MPSLHDLPTHPVAERGRPPGYQPLVTEFHGTLEWRKPYFEVDVRYRVGREARRRIWRGFTRSEAVRRTLAGLKANGHGGKTIRIVLDDDHSLKTQIPYPVPRLWQ